MFPEIGHFALALALVLALVQSVLPIAGASRGNAVWMKSAQATAIGQVLFVAIAFAALMQAFIASDFTVRNVVENSHSLKPMLYKVTGVWGNHEGSMLLWILVLALFGAIVGVFGRNLPPGLKARTLAVQGLIAVGFLLFTLVTSNPFARSADPPVDGNGLNPLLQDPGLAFHPPMLYTGYVGFSIVFAFAVAALIEGRVDAAWARWVRPWTLLAWCFLTAGIALGSWWAYYELGWGGWWFWDPVENASFLPWLTGTALLHSAIVVERREALKTWTILLAIVTFAMSLIGTFLVRSGVLTSVHAFATDPTRGVFILGFLGVVVGGSLLLYAWRGPQTLGGSRFEGVSRETFLLGNNVILIVSMLTVLLGTLYPLVVETLGYGKLSVGPPYFNLVFVPLMVLLLALVGVGSMVRWKRDSVARLWTHLRYALVASVVLGIAMAAMVGGGSIEWGVVLGLGLAVWVVLGNIQAVRTQLSGQRGTFAALRRLPAGVYGMTLAHIGLAVTVVGITISSAYNIESRLRMAPGETAEIAGYTVRFEGVKRVQGPNYRSATGDFVVTRDNETVTTLSPEKRFYASGGQPMTEAGIDPGFTHDLYASLGESLDDSGAWSVRLYHKPFVRWIWLGAALMSLGGLLAVTDRRYRSHRRRQADMTAAQAAGA